MADTNDRLTQILTEALEKSSVEERDTFLRTACRNDAALRSQLEELLTVHEGSEQAFRAKDESARPVFPVSEGPGGVIGRYKLLERIGEGGMGVVYMAEQTEPVSRRVALKIIKVGMDTKQVVARFEAERQALAMMDHPNIARVLDGGSTETGRPYFVMELVEGIPITQYCDQNKLSTQERIELYIPVCQAIQSAHQKGIIHRDIKPSNVLVTLHQGEPTPKVIDFGIAKATHQKLTEKTFFTQFAAMIGTPAYMSPEQAGTTAMDIDTRTDVYSLGVLLYQLLTGSTPFPEKRLRAAGYGEIQRIIAEEEPPKPSTRMSSLVEEEKSTVAQSRGVDGSALQRMLRGDLDWITMKCLEKDRRRRYDTPTELAADLKRYLSDEPVSAAAPSLAYRFAKFHRKHKVPVWSALSASAVLVIATVLSGSLAIRMNQLRKEEADQREATEIQRDRATNAEQAVLERSIDLENHLYVSDLLAVEQAVANENWSYVREALNRHRVEPSGNDLRGFEWRYYWMRSRGAQIAAFQAHEGPVAQIEFSSDGKHLLTAGQEGKVKLWDLPEKRLLQERNSSKVAISKNWRRMVTFSNGEFQCLSLPDMSVVSTWSIPGGSVNSLDLSADGRFVAAGMNDGRGLFESGRAFVWNSVSGELIRSLPGVMLGVSLSPAQPLLAAIGPVGGLQGPFDPNLLPPMPEVHVSNFERTEELEPLIKAPGGRARYSPSGRYIAIAGFGSPIQIFEVSSRMLTATIPESIIRGVFSFSSDEIYLATNGGHPRRVNIWEIEGGAKAGVVDGQEGWVNCALFDPLSSDRLITGSVDRVLSLWDWKEDRRIMRLTGHGSEITTLAVNHTGTTAITGSENGTVMVWDFTVGQSTTNGIANAYTMPVPVFSQSGRLMVLNEWTGRPEMGGARFEGYDIPRPRRSAAETNVLSSPAAPAPPGAETEQPETARPSPRANQPRDWQESVFDSSSLERLWVIPDDERTLGFSPDNQTLLTVGTTAVHFRSATDGEVIQTVQIDPPIDNLNFYRRGAARWVALAPDGSRFAVTEDQNTVRLIDLSTGRTLASLDEPRLATQLLFSPSGDQVLFCSMEGAGGIWQPDHGTTILLSPQSEAWWISGLDVSPDSPIAAGACSDNTLRIWRLDSGELIHAVKGFRKDLTSVSFSSDGRTLAVNMDMVELWNTRTWRRISGFSHPSPSLGGWFSPNGRFLISSALGRGATFWRAPGLDEIDHGGLASMNPDEEIEVQ